MRDLCSNLPNISIQSAGTEESDIGFFVLPLVALNVLPFFIGTQYLPADIVAGLPTKISGKLLLRNPFLETQN
jgi:hypothetical protein